MGAELKNTFSINFQNKILTSQYNGNVNDLEASKAFRENLKHFLHTA